MKIIVLTIAVFTLNVYVTRATSLDPTHYVETEDAKSRSDDARTKRSGDLFSSLLKKKFGLFSSLAGSSSGKSIGHSEGHYEEPLSYHTKSFNLWGVKKAIMGSVLQAAKAITGGVIALKGQLIKAKGHVVVAKGKLMQTKGEAISNFGKTIATHAFDSHQHEPELEVHSVGLYNHLPVTPIHQPTSYGAATGLGYQQQAYPNNAYPSNAYPSQGYQINSYPAEAQSYPTGFAVPSTGYDAGAGYGGYGGNGFTAKRAVQQNAQESSNLVNPMKNLVDKDSVQAGLLIFKPIKVPQSPHSNGASSFGAQQNFNQRPASMQLNGNGYHDFKGALPTGAGYQSPFPGGAPSASGYQSVPSGGGGGSGGYPQLYQNPGYSQNGGGYVQAHGAYQFPTGSGGSGVGASGGGGVGVGASGGGLGAGLGAGLGGDSLETFAGQAAYGLQNFAFPQPANSQEFNRQLQQAAAAFPGQAPYSLEADNHNNNNNYNHNNNNNYNNNHNNNDNYNNNDSGDDNSNYGGDQRDSASDSQERVAQPSYKNARRAEAPKPPPRSAATAADFFLPTTTRYADEARGPSSRANKRSAAAKAADATTPRATIVPLKYHDDSDAEDQARLKQTVQRFFSMLQKQP